MALSPNDELNLMSPYNNDNDYGYSFSMSATANSNGQDGYGITGSSNDAYDIGGDAIAYASDVPPAMPNIGHHSNPGLLGNDSSNMGHGGDQYAAGDQDQYATGGQVQYSASSQLTDFGNGLANSAATSRPMSVQPSSGFVEVESSIKTEDDDEFNDYVSFTPSPGDEYDESEDSDGFTFEGFRAKPIPKTNKNGTRRKPRLPRAKLLKWTDNDWKNVVLGIIWACGETGTQIPFDQAAQIVGESCTAGALQQAVLKLRQKQVAEGNWIPSLRMAWTRKPRNSDPSLLNADDAKVSKDAAKPKTMLGKKKATRFSGNQSLIVTLKRAYSESDREHLGKFHVLADKVNDFLHTPIQKLRHLSASATGSPNPRRADLSIDTQKIRNANRKARITDHMLVQYSPYEKPADLSTPGLTPSLGYGNEFGTSTPDLTPSLAYGNEFATPTPAIESDNEFVVASRGTLLWTPPNTVTADSAVARLLGSHPLNPQGFLQYEAYSTPVNPSATANVTTYGGTGEHPGDDQLMRAQASLNAARGDTDVNTFYVPAPAEDPFTRY
ncbi:hypothetical protein J1614_005243 [Plenodomus biglobosus]|nr:hypothetical protein J1614_005243 [Plenodomus biglobosus]